MENNCAQCKTMKVYSKLVQSTILWAITFIHNVKKKLNETEKKKQAKIQNQRANSL